MARSRRKTPITGNTTAESEKYDKRIANRRLRRRVNEILDQADVEHSPDILPEIREVSDPWTMSKDGKKPFDPQKHPALMRK